MATVESTSDPGLIDWEFYSPNCLPLGHRGMGGVGTNGRGNRRVDPTRRRQRGIMRRSWRMAHNLKGGQA